jgi:hypothetical protein
VGGPLKYELECGHCGSVFTLEEAAVTRQVRCPICGGGLTVAVPIPIVPVVPPAGPFPPPPAPLLPPVVPPPPPIPADVPPIPAPPVPAPSFPSFSPALPDLSDLPPELRAMYLAPPWPSIRTALDRARLATYVSLSLFGLLLFADLVVAGFVGGNERLLFVKALMALALAQMFPLLIHIAVQIVCTAAPATHGGELPETSVWLLGLAMPAAAGLVLADMALLAVLVGGGMALLSFMLWLRFLGRIGQRLGDRALVAGAWSFSSWFWTGFAVGMFLVCASLRGGVGDGWSWLGRAFAGGIGLRLLVGYAALLRTASLAVARRGPVRHKL